MIITRHRRWFPHFQLPILTFVLNALPATGPTDTRVSWPLVYANGKPSCSMTYRWLKNCCVLFVSFAFQLFFLCFFAFLGNKPNHAKHQGVSILSQSGWRAVSLDRLATLSVTLAATG